MYCRGSLPRCNRQGRSPCRFPLPPLRGCPPQRPPDPYDEPKPPEGDSFGPFSRLQPVSVLSLPLSLSPPLQPPLSRKPASLTAPPPRLPFRAGQDAGTTIKRKDRLLRWRTSQPHLALPSRWRDEVEKRGTIEASSKERSPALDCGGNLLGWWGGGQERDNLILQAGIPHSNRKYPMAKDFPYETISDVGG